MHAANTAQGLWQGFHLPTGTYDDKVLLLSLPGGCARLQPAGFYALPSNTRWSAIWRCTHGQWFGSSSLRVCPLLVMMTMLFVSALQECPLL